MRPEAFSTDMSPAQAVEALVKVAAAGREKRAEGFLDQLKQYGEKGIAAAGRYAGQGAEHVRQGLTSGDASTRGLYGMGVGGIAGGLAGGLAGATGSRKKSPWTTALSGAIGGAALGGGAAAAAPAIRDAYLGQGAAPPPGMAGEAKADAAKAPILERAMGKITGDEAYADQHPMNIASDALAGRWGGKPTSTPGSISKGPGQPVTTAGPSTPTNPLDFRSGDGIGAGGYAAGVGAGVGGHHLVDRLQSGNERQRMFNHGAAEALKGVKPDAMTPVQQRLRDLHARTGAEGLFTGRGASAAIGRSLRDGSKDMGTIVGREAGTLRTPAAYTGNATGGNALPFGKMAPTSVVGGPPGPHNYIPSSENHPRRPIHANLRQGNSAINDAINAGRTGGKIPVRTPGQRAWGYGKGGLVGGLGTLATDLWMRSHRPGEGDQ